MVECLTLRCAPPAYFISAHLWDMMAVPVWIPLVYASAGWIVQFEHITCACLRPSCLHASTCTVVLHTFAARTVTAIWLRCTLRSYTTKKVTRYRVRKWKTLVWHIQKFTARDRKIVYPRELRFNGSHLKRPQNTVLASFWLCCSFSLYTNWRD